MWVGKNDPCGVAHNKMVIVIAVDANNQINHPKMPIFDHLRGRAFHAPFRLEMCDPAGVGVPEGNVDVVSYQYKMKIRLLPVNIDKNLRNNKYFYDIAL
jgi:hypothetical protein